MTQQAFFRGYNCHYIFALLANCLDYVIEVTCTQLEPYILPSIANGKMEENFQTRIAGYNESLTDLDLVKDETIA